MPIRNRELSQFGSFVFIDDASQNIGIATTASPSVGIGTTNPIEKLHVYGNTKLEGDLEITGTFNFPVGELTFDQNTNDFNFYTSGIVTAGEFRNTSGLALTAFDSWSTSGSDIYRVSGNVGINSSIPTQKLDVGGNIAVSGDISASGNVTAGNQLISNVAGTRISGTAPLQVASSYVVANLNATYLQDGAPGGTASNDIVTNGASQTLSNKTFSGSGVVFNGSSSGSTILKATSTAGSGTVSLPTTTGTLVCTGDSGSVTSGMIADGAITNTDINTSAAIAYSKLNLNNSIVNGDIVNGTIQNIKLANSTISNVSLGNNLNTLTFGTYLQANGTSYNGSAAVTIATNGTSSNTASTLVARDGSGNFNAGSISLTGNLSATAGSVSGNSLSATTGGLSVTGTAFINNSTPSISTGTGALRVSGGVGILENVWVGGTINGSLANTLTLNTFGTGLSGSTSYNNSGAATFTVTSNATSSNTASAIVARDASGNFAAGTITAPTLQGSTANSGTLTVKSTSSATKATAGVLFNDGIASSSTTTGTVVVTGGAGVSGNLYVGGTVTGTSFVKSGATSTNLLQAGGGDVSATSIGGVPTGAILPYGSTTAPSGWLLCDGSSLSTTTYAALFAVIGYKFGGSGSSFNIPQMNGYFPNGTTTDATIGTVPNNNVQPSTGGNNSGALIKYFAYIIKT